MLSIHNGERIVSSTKVLAKLDIPTQNNENEPLSNNIHKNQFKVKPETVKFLKENTRESLLDTAFGNNFLAMIGDKSKNRQVGLSQAGNQPTTQSVHSLGFFFVCFVVVVVLSLLISKARFPASPHIVRTPSTVGVELYDHHYPFP